MSKKSKKTKKLWALFTVRTNVSIDVDKSNQIVKLVAWSYDKDMAYDFMLDYPIPEELGLDVKMLEGTLDSLKEIIKKKYPKDNHRSILTDHELAYVGYGMCAPAKYAGAYIESFINARQHYDDCIKMIQDIMDTGACTGKEVKVLKKAKSIVQEFRDVNIEEYPTNEVCEEYLKNRESFLDKMRKI